MPTGRTIGMEGGQHGELVWLVGRLGQKEGEGVKTLYHIDSLHNDRPHPRFQEKEQLVMLRLPNGGVLP